MRARILLSFLTIIERHSVGNDGDGEDDEDDDAVVMVVVSLFFRVSAHLFKLSRSDQGLDFIFKEYIPT
jgi:hypothetical protein